MAVKIGTSDLGGVSGVYFAYGSNMDEEQMAARCSGAVQLATAVLEGYRFIINGQGVASVVTSPRSRVHGLLWSLTQQHEESLDEYEGVDEGIYSRETRRVMRAAGPPVAALIYVAADCTEGPPQPGYFERIIAAAQRLDFPSEYQRELRAWQR
jgi:gamma-glutamylcyclotransferase (GGCT)/AIG2-like uncharacterized protein YtfP